MRLFFAAEPGAAARAAFAACLSRLQAPDADVKWNEAPHLTLAFLGEQPEARLPAAKAAAGRTAASARPFDATLSAPGVFRDRGRPRVLWLGVSAPALPELARSLRAELARDGFAPETQPFSPHLTAGRVRTARGLPETLAELERLAGDARAPWRDVPFPVREFSLFESRLGPDGASHAELARFPLGAA
ncbi:MAG TPA: RNA 2',3'-cyclic phosphodiesterase [Elusimicrobiota bacterium]|jgi:2'-5' RNA ligase|nr:RNA 2',3'-cyclic phosphodiesterase [Elusimicrobiota bacterium]